MAYSSAARAIPTAIAETPGRVRSRVIIASLKPLFSSASRFAAGISTSSKEMVAVLEARWPILSSFLSTRDPGEVGVYDEGADPAVTGLRVGLGEDGEVVGVGAVGDEALGAADHVLVALFHGLGLHAADVGAGVRLGQAKRSQLRSFGEHPEVLLLRLLGAAEGDRGRGEAVGHQRGADPGAAPPNSSSIRQPER